MKATAGQAVTAGSPSSIAMQTSGTTYTVSVQSMPTGSMGQIVVADQQRDGLERVCGDNKGRRALDASWSSDSSLALCS